MVLIACRWFAACTRLIGQRVDLDPGLNDDLVAHGGHCEIVFTNPQSFTMNTVAGRSIVDGIAVRSFAEEFWLC
jgi:hypothetical protein